MEPSERTVDAPRPAGAPGDLMIELGLLIELSFPDLLVVGPDPEDASA